MSLSRFEKRYFVKTVSEVVEALFAIQEEGLAQKLDAYDTLQEFVEEKTDIEIEKLWAAVAELQAAGYPADAADLESWLKAHNEYHHRYQNYAEEIS